MDFTLITTEMQQARKIRGLVADVARKMGLSHEHVRQVAGGDRTSARVAKALLAEKRLRDRKDQKQRKVAA